MIVKLFSTVMAMSIFIVFQCSFADDPKQSFVLGDWKGKIQNETLIDGNKTTNTILVHLSFKENWVVEIEEVHLNDGNKNLKISKQYKFLSDNIIEISGFEEKFVINSKGQNEMFLDLTEEYKWEKDVPLISTVKLNRIEKSQK
ncbi:MAG: hypothetical protein HC846_06810 [Blastocatellia bacterium]|nr:hypothetical protein [Blastocatellia bacterium]